MIKPLIATLMLLVPLSANAVYKCVTPQPKGSKNSSITYSNVPCGENAEYINLGEEQNRKREEEIRIAKEQYDRNQARIWKEEEPTRTQNELAALKGKLKKANKAARDADMWRDVESAWLQTHPGGRF